MNKIEKVKVFNTLTGKFEEVEVTAEIATVYRRNAWNIKDNDESFFDHEIQISSLIGGSDNAYENFREFKSMSRDVQDEFEEKLLVEKLHMVLADLDETDYRIIYLLFHEELSERDVADIIGVSQPVLHRKKRKILKKIKIFLI